MGQPVTTNPYLIGLINMIVVFVVLFGLSLIIRFIYLVDPTRKKMQPKVESIDQVIKATAMNDSVVLQEDHDEMILLFTAAIAAYGCTNARIVAIRPIPSTAWNKAGRMELVNAQKQGI